MGKIGISGKKENRVKRASGNNEQDELGNW
jgi:hypothetical protein